VITALDVILVFDGTIHPPGWKMIVCVCPVNGFYFRINSKPWPEAVVIRLPDHRFLTHDSHIECNGPLDMDDFSIQESIAAKGIIGRIDVKVVPEIVAAVDRCRSISPVDKDIIFSALKKTT
jgi:hypothetical protein